MLRREAIRERLLRLEEVVSRLEQLGRDRSSTSPQGFRDAWAAERGLQLGAEILFDVGNHILAARFGTSARDYEDIVARLGEHAVIDAALRQRLKGLGGFRNVLVHGYLQVDPARVAAALARAPRDFAEFAGAVRRWLESVPE